MRKLRAGAGKGFRSVYVVMLLSLLALFASGCQKKNLTNDDFLLTVKNDKNIKSGETAAFVCELTIPQWVRIKHGSQMIRYAVDGEGEIITSQEIIEQFFKGQTIERTVSLTFAEKGEHTITFFSEFEVVNGDGSTKYLVEKDVTVNVS